MCLKKIKKNKLFFWSKGSKCGITFSVFLYAFMSNPDPVQQIITRREEKVVGKKTKIKVLDVYSYQSPLNIPTVNGGFYYFYAIGVLNKILAGNANYQRVGINVTPIGMKLSLSFTWGGDGFVSGGGSVNNILRLEDTTLSCPCRAILYWDSQPNGSTNSLTDLLKTVSASGVVNQYSIFPSTAPQANVNTPSISSSINVDNLKRFIIIRDKYFNLSDPTPFVDTTNTVPTNLYSSSQAPNNTKSFNWDVDFQKELKKNKFKNIFVRSVFDNALASQNINSGQICLCLYVLKKGVTVTINSRYYYKDK